jgi:phospholipid N-methyltransferase
MMFHISYLFLSLFFSFITNLEAHDHSIQHIQKALNFTQSDIENRGRCELKGFVDSQVWKGGYYEGDPTNPHGSSSYHVKMLYKGQMVNPLYICLQECIKPYVTSQTTVLEIGPGQGAWSRCILALNPKKLLCLDALSAEHNQFWNKISRQNNLEYLQIRDFSLNELQDNSIDFVFSFGTFCHISSLLCYEYFKNLFPKLRKGAQGFVMYADYDKCNRFAAVYNMPHAKVSKGDEIAFFQYQQEKNMYLPVWYHLGIERAQSILQELGYEVIASDININERDPIIHFRKP